MEDEAEADGETEEEPDDVRCDGGSKTRFTIARVAAI